MKTLKLTNDELAAVREQIEDALQGLVPPAHDRDAGRDLVLAAEMMITPGRLTARSARYRAAGMEEIDVDETLEVARPLVGALKAILKAEASA